MWAKRRKLIKTFLPITSLIKIMPVFQFFCTLTWSIFVLLDKRLN